jgi:hypothetical protein
VYQFGFVIFWQKDFGAKAAHKMLVKLTPTTCSVLCALLTIAFVVVDFWLINMP